MCSSMLDALDIKRISKKEQNKMIRYEYSTKYLKMYITCFNNSRKSKKPFWNFVIGPKSNTSIPYRMFMDAFSVRTPGKPTAFKDNINSYISAYTLCIWKAAEVENKLIKLLSNGYK